MKYNISIAATLPLACLVEQKSYWANVAMSDGARWNDGKEAGRFQLFMERDHIQTVAEELCKNRVELEGKVHTLSAATDLQRADPACKAASETDYVLLVRYFQGHRKEVSAMLSKLPEVRSIRHLSGERKIPIKNAGTRDYYVETNNAVADMYMYPSAYPGGKEVENEGTDMDSDSSGEEINENDEMKIEG